MMHDDSDILWSHIIYFLGHSDCHNDCHNVTLNIFHCYSVTVLRPSSFKFYLKELKDSIFATENFFLSNYINFKILASRLPVFLNPQLPRDLLPTVSWGLPGGLPVWWLGSDNHEPCKSRLGSIREMFRPKNEGWDFEQMHVWCAANLKWNWCDSEGGGYGPSVVTTKWYWLLVPWLFGERLSPWVWGLRIQEIRILGLV